MPLKKNEDAAGKQAIEDALKSFYGQKATRYFHAHDGFSRAEAEALEGIAVYKSISEKPHWHYITYGFSELAGKESEDEECSGYGFELTLRLLVGNDEQSPPSWPCDLLNDVARHVFELTRGLQPGSSLALEKPITSRSSCALQGIVFIADVELGTIFSVNGKIQFLQAVPLTADEMEILSGCDAQKFLGIAKQRLGKLLITDISRQSIADDPCLALQLETGINPEKEHNFTISCPIAEWIFTSKLSVALSTGIVEELKTGLPERLKAGASLTVRGPECKIIFRPAGKLSFSIDETDLIIELPDETVAAFAESLEPVTGFREIKGLPLAFEFVEAKDIKDDSLSKMMQSLTDLN